MRLNRQHGFTIVELMVAATLGILILGGAISMFVSNKRIYTEQDEMGRLQENARFAMEMIIRDVRMAGHTGCNDDVATVTNHIEGADDVTSIHNFAVIEGSENGGAWALSGLTTDVGTSDGITVRYLADTDSNAMDPAMSAADVEIYTSGGSRFKVGDRVALADCNSADIVVVTGITKIGAAGCTSTGPTNVTCQDELAHVNPLIV
jgi:type IV pilus assembly protein PilW